MSRGTTNGLSIEQLEQLLNSRRNQLNKLLKERGKLEKRMEMLDAEIRELGGNTGGRGSRARNDISLVEAIESVMREAGKPMKVGDILAGVQARGYRSNSANFRGIVNQTLIKEKQFTQASRGVYQLKK
ncbi:MAG TPA: hypothetical protein VF669_01615 [Tepidisphaeraceae bacterium]|jgi:hypothetical protein